MGNNEHIFSRRLAVEEMKDKMIAKQREGSAKSFLIWMIFRRNYCLVA